MKGNTVKIVVGAIIIGGYAILFTTGFKYGWHEGVLWYLIGYTVLLVGTYLINRYLTRKRSRE